MGVENFLARRVQKALWGALIVLECALFALSLPKSELQEEKDRQCSDNLLVIEQEGPWDL
jgi:hypothetical protein